MEGAQEAEIVTRLVLDGTVFMIKIAGQTAAGAARLLTFLAAAAKSENVMGQKRLASLLKMDRSPELFTLDESQIGDFKKEAKKYGIAYHIVWNKDLGVYDVLVPKEDAVRLNRVLDNIGYATLTAEETDEEKDVENGGGADNGMSEIRELINKLMQPDGRETNPHQAADQTDSRSAASSMVSDLPENMRGSVAEKIDEINTALENSPKEEKDDMGRLLAMMLKQEDGGKAGAFSMAHDMPEKPLVPPEATVAVAVSGKEHESGLEELNEAFERLMGSLNRSNPDKERS